MMLTPAMDGLLQQMGETHTHDSRHRGRGGLAQGTIYYTEWAKPAERTPGVQLQKRWFAQWMVYYIEWARPTERNPTTEDDVGSRNERVTTRSGRHNNLNNLAAGWVGGRVGIQNLVVGGSCPWVMQTQDAGLAMRHAPWVTGHNPKIAWAMAKAIWGPGPEAQAHGA